MRRATTGWWFEGVVLAALAAVALVHRLPDLPPPSLALGVCAAALGAAAAGAWRRRRRWASAAGVLALAAWTAHGAANALSDRLDPALEGVDLKVEGRIASAPMGEGAYRRFEFTPRRGWRGSTPVALPGRVRLSWYGPAPALAAGETWRLTVRLKRPHGFANPGAFDYERWLLTHGIGATGYVRERPSPERLAGPDGGAATLRQALGTRLAAHLPEGRGGTLVRALALGDTSAISPDIWGLLRSTGTTHLVAVSGLHVSLVGGLVFGLVRVLWPWLGSATRYWPAPAAAAPAAAAGALGYALLTGFGVPAQRAALTFALAMAGIVLRREVRLGRLLAVVLLVVLVSDPLAALTPGFWLSFGAVAAIVYLVGGRSRAGLVRGAVRLQMGLGVLLAVPVIGFFGLVTPASLPANLLAVPWVSFVSTPLSLAAGLAADVPGLGAALATAAAASLDGLLEVTGFFAARLPAWGWPTPPLALQGLALIGAAVVVAPRGVPGRVAGAACLVPLAVWRPPLPAAGEAWVDVLDVGQGLAAVVRTRDHTLVYDTGPRLGSHLDGALAAVLPVLRQRGARSVDALIVSHADGDHAGGLDSLREALPVDVVYSGTPEELDAVAARQCRAGQSWQWDGVTFSMLHPPERFTSADRNARSCVLRVDAGGGVLLTGDIGKAQERVLVRAGVVAPAAVVVAAHHGSRSSSSPAWVRAVTPEHVIFTAGYRNRYRHPAEIVQKRYAAAGAQCWCSARDGAVTFHLSPDSPLRLGIERLRERRYWRPRPDRPGECAC